MSLHLFIPAGFRIRLVCNRQKLPEKMPTFAAERLIVPLLKISGYTTDCIVRHKKYAKKSCPGERFKVIKLRNLVETLSD